LVTALRIRVSTLDAISLLPVLETRLDNVYTDNMASNANSVNIKESRRYHHGRLRAELVRIGLEHLAREPAASLSLREIAREAGVSATAVYRHFPDKRALERALCREGGEMLGAAQAEAMRQAGGGRAGFDAVGRAYVRFALANPALFRLMTTMRYEGDPFTADDDHQSSAMRLLRGGIAELAGEGAGDGEQRIRAIRSWAAVHGLALLMLDGQLPADDALIDAAIQSDAIISPER
jgi:AcrR family transcriptional regulator